VIERRIIRAGNLEVRATEAGREYRGDAIRFGEPSENLGGFIEYVSPDCEIGGDDVRHLINHDANLVLGRTTAGTTQLERRGDAIGVVTDMPDTSYARDLAVSIERGDVDQMSFGFRIVKRADGSPGDSWDWSVKPAVRTLHAIELNDVSTVTYPAYPTTSASVRSELRSHGIEPTIRRAVGSANVVWDDEAGACDYMDDVSESLPVGFDGDDYAFGYCADVTMSGDEALVVWYDNGECELFVVPVASDDQGEPYAAPQEAWQPVEWALIASEPDDVRAIRAQLERRAGKAISSANAEHVSALADAHAAMGEHLDALVAASSGDAEPDADAADEALESNAARLDFERRLLAIREAGGDPDNERR
jgi:HK97 family phage prohead protease